MAGPWEKYQTAESAPAAAPVDSGPWAKYASQDPTSGNSFLQNVAAGAGGAITDLGLGIKQRYLELAEKMGGTRPNLDREMFGTTVQEQNQKTQGQVASKRELDAPLLGTAGGKTGNFIGKAAPATVAAFVPGGQSLAGSVIAGGLSGLAEPTVSGESVARNGAAGMAGGALGYGVGKLIGAAGNKLIERGAEKATANSVKDATAAAARDAGYVIPPVQTNPTIANRALEGFSGKIATAQSASTKNQPVTNRLVAESLGLPPGEPITKDALIVLRNEASRAYEAIRGAGPIQADQEYDAALNGIVKKFQGASKDFPELAKNDIEGIVTSINKPAFGADSAVDAIKILRERATKAYSQGDKGTGKAYREASDAMESLIERNLEAQGSKDVLNAFRDARTLIAKTYSVENALNESTGNVVATKLAGQLKRGKPLSGELKTVAQFGQAFPKAADEIRSSMPGVSPLDFYAATAAAAIDPKALLTLGARPAVRSMLLSRPYQNVLASPSYGGSPMLNALATSPARAAIQGGAVAGLPELLK